MSELLTSDFKIFLRFFLFSTTGFVRGFVPWPQNLFCDFSSISMIYRSFPSLGPPCPARNITVPRYLFLFDLTAFQTKKNGARRSLVLYVTTRECRKKINYPSDNSPNIFTVSIKGGDIFLDDVQRVAIQNIARQPAFPEPRNTARQFSDCT
jgi:hypothetical protein